MLLAGIPWGFNPPREDGLMVVDSSERPCPGEGFHTHIEVAGDDTGHHNPVMCPFGNLLAFRCCLQLEDTPLIQPSVGTGQEIPLAIP